MLANMTTEATTEIEKSTTSDDKIWRSIVRYGLDGAVDREKISRAEATAILEKKCKRALVSQDVVNRLRGLRLAQIDAMLQPQITGAIEDGEKDYVDAAVALMKQEQTYVPGLKVADKQEITGADGGAVQVEAKVLASVIEAQDMVDDLIGALRAKAV